MNILNSKKFIGAQLVFVGLLFSNTIYAKEDESLNNSNVYSSQLQIQNLKYDQKINRAQFLPEFSINTGIGSEKYNDKVETEQGPILYLDGKLNLYRGGRDLNLKRITSAHLSIAKLELQVAQRTLKTNTFRKISEIENLTTDNLLIESELKINKQEQLMAAKKVNAGLSTNADLIDFDLKNENLNNEKEKNLVRSNEILLELLSLYQNKLTLAEIKQFISGDTKDLLNVTDIKMSLEFRQKFEQHKVAKLEIKNAQSEYYPTVDLEAKWGQITPHHKILDSNNREHQVLLNINFPLFSGFTSDSKTQKAILLSSQKERELKEVEIDLQNKLDLDLKKVALLNKIISSLDHSLQKANQYKELILNEYKRGIKNSSDVINATDRKFELERKINDQKLELSNVIFSMNQKFLSYKEN